MPGFNCSIPAIATRYRYAARDSSPCPTTDSVAHVVTRRVAASPRIARKPSTRLSSRPFRCDEPRDGAPDSGACHNDGIVRDRLAIVAADGVFSYGDLAAVAARVAR